MEFPWPKHLVTEGSQGAVSRNPSQGLFNGFDWVAQHLLGREEYMNKLNSIYTTTSADGTKIMHYPKVLSTLEEMVSEAMRLPMSAMPELWSVTESKGSGNSGLPQARIKRLRTFLDSYGHALATGYYLRNELGDRQGYSFKFESLIEVCNKALELWQLHAGEWYLVRESRKVDSKWKILTKPPEINTQVYPCYYVQHNGGVDIYKGRSFYANYVPPRVSLRDMPIVNPEYWDDTYRVSDGLQP